MRGRAGAGPAETASTTRGQGTIACLAALVFAATLLLGAAVALAASAPTVLTKAADHLGATHAQLHATINPNGEATVYWFEYGLEDCETIVCTAIPASKDASAGEGSTAFPVAQAIGGLQPETTYHFRVLAHNASGTTAGLDETFVTPATPAPPGPCANEELREEQHATFLPDCRAYEMASPPDKNGGWVIPLTGGTFAAADGSAASFKSLVAFGDAIGTNVATEYVSLRSDAADPGDNGWSTHAITPAQDSSTIGALYQLLEPGYLGELSSDVAMGTFRPASPLTDEPLVAQVPNLYLRTDLRTPGPGSYQLITACPRCVEKGPLSEPKSYFEAFKKRPVPAGFTPDYGHVIFESTLRLTDDTPAGVDTSQLFEWEGGTVRLVDRVPSSGSECDDAGGPACKGGVVAMGGFSNRTGPGELGSGAQLPPHTISDGGDGHVRIFFTRPTNAKGAGTTEGSSGLIYLREDAHYTSQLNASERTSPDAFAPARLQDASPNGERAFFASAQALTEDAPVNGASKLYMYDASKPGSDPHNLTLLSVDNEPADGSTGDVSGAIGAGGQGHYLYFVAKGQLVAGAPALGEAKGIYLWHNGTLSYVGPYTGSDREIIPASRLGVEEGAQLSRVTPDGRHLLFGTFRGEGLLGYGQGTFGSCKKPEAAPGCREFYLYDAEGSTPTEPDLRCVSCRPDGTIPSAPVTDYAQSLEGGTRAGSHVSRVFSADGSRVFFSTADPLVPEDTNGYEDAYEYDATTEEVHLLSTGTAPADSWFLDASSDGSDAFIVTSQRLVGWDRDGAYDLYDVRIGGGFPEPVPVPAPCPGESCQGPAGMPPEPASVGSTLEGPGNPEYKRPKCPKGKRLSRVKGKTRCVKPKKHRAKQRRRAAGAKRGGGR